MNRIKQLRKQKNVTITELSKALGIPQSTLTNYENGKRTPRDQEVWQLIANYFGVSVGFVMGISNLNRTEIPDDPYSIIEKSTEYDHYYNDIEQAFTIFSEALISPLSTNSSNELISDSINQLAISYDSLLHWQGPEKAKKLAEALQLVNDLSMASSYNKMFSPHKSDDELNQSIQDNKKQLCSVLDELIESDKNFYTGESIHSHKPFYDDLYKKEN